MKIQKIHNTKKRYREKNKFRGNIYKDSKYSNKNKKKNRNKSKKIKNIKIYNKTRDQT